MQVWKSFCNDILPTSWNLCGSEFHTSGYKRMTKEAGATKLLERISQATTEKLVDLKQYAFENVFTNAALGLGCLFSFGGTIYFLSNAYKDYQQSHMDRKNYGDMSKLDTVRLAHHTRANEKLTSAIQNGFLGLTTFSLGVAAVTAKRWSWL